MSNGFGTITMAMALALAFSITMTIFAPWFTVPLVDYEEEQQYEQVCNEQFAPEWEYDGLGLQVNETHTEIDCRKDMGFLTSSYETVITEDIHGGKEGKSFMGTLWDRATNESAYL